MGVLSCGTLGSDVAKSALNQNMRYANDDFLQDEFWSDSLVPKVRELLEINSIVDSFKIEN